MRTYRGALFTAALVVIATMLAFALHETTITGAQTPPKPTVLKMQTALPAASFFLDRLNVFADRVHKMTGGRLKIDVLPSGAVVGGFDILDAVDRGVVEMGYAWPQYWGGKHPAATLFSNPPAGTGGLDQFGLMAWLAWGGGLDLLKELYRDVLKVNVESLPIHMSGFQSLGWFKKPFNNVEALRKVKFRVPPGLPGEVYKEMGVPAVSLGGSEVIPAAERGVIDAAEWITPAEDIKVGLQHVFKNMYLQGLHQATDVAEIYVNGKAWNGLPADVREIVKGAVHAELMDSFIEGIHRNALALKEIQTKHGVRVLETPKDYYPEFLKAARRVTDRYAQKDPFFRKVLESQRKFAETVVPYWVSTIKTSVALGEVITGEKK